MSKCSRDVLLNMKRRDTKHLLRFSQRSCFIRKSSGM